MKFCIEKYSMKDNQYLFLCNKRGFLFFGTDKKLAFKFYTNKYAEEFLQLLKCSNNFYYDAKFAFVWRRWLW